MYLGYGFRVRVHRSFTTVAVVSNVRCLVLLCLELFFNLLSSRRRIKMHIARTVARTWLESIYRYSSTTSNRWELGGSCNGGLFAELFCLFPSLARLSLTLYGS